METRRIALLIDGDNISAKYTPYIIEEVAKYGIASYRRIYGDWTSTQAGKWKDELQANSLMPVQQFANTVGKNATDSALIIDAMDILYGGDVEGFCIVSSDSDFTRLASRLREKAMMVIGMGESKTPPSFRNACTKFVSLENLLGSEESAVSDVIDQADIENAIATFMEENEGKGKQTSLAMIGASLNNKYPDFDVRNYGYSSLSKFIDDMSRFDIERSNDAVYVNLHENETKRDEIEDFIRAELKTHRSKSMPLGDLSNVVHMQFPDFDQHDFGYAQFNRFVQSITGVEVVTSTGNDKNARLETQ